MSQFSSESINQTILELFSNASLKGIDIARNSQVTTIVKRDSNDFAHELIKHPRGIQIVCELLDIALRPQNSIVFEQNPKPENVPQQQKQTKKKLESSQTTITYNALEILTNQYEQFVQFVFGNSQAQKQEGFQNKDFSDEEDMFAGSASNIHIQMKSSVKYGQTPINFLPENQINQQEQRNPYRDSTQSLKSQQWDKCVIMDPNFKKAEVKNQQEEVSPMGKKPNLHLSVERDIIETPKQQEKQLKKSSKLRILDQMFKLFQQPVPIQETPVSYFNKITLQFLYQKPQQILHYFYQNDKGQPNCEKIKVIARHLYNNSVIDLFLHIMELENDGNFYPAQKTKIFRVIAQQVFNFEDSIESKIQTEEFNDFSSPNTSQLQNNGASEMTVTEMIESKIQNYVSLLHSIYQKLEDKYEQEKYLPIFKQHLNDEKLTETMIKYFFLNFNYFDMGGLLSLLAEILKADQTNFRLSKISSQPSNPFGNKDSSFHNKNQQSSLLSYDLKLSENIMKQIEGVIVKLTDNYQKWQGNNSTLRTIQYYDLVYNWLTVAMAMQKQKKEVKSSKQGKNGKLTKQAFLPTVLVSPSFINLALLKMEAHQNSTILHNLIKNIITEFLPKLSDPLGSIILVPECKLLSFVQVQLQQSLQKVKQIKKQQKRSKKINKCYSNQVFHIAKCLVSLWQQRKMLGVMTKTYEDQEDYLDQLEAHRAKLPPPPSSPTSNSQYITRFENIKKLTNSKQQHYDKLICGDPRKMGEYQQEQSSEIIMASSFKNFFKPSNVGNQILPQNQGSNIISESINRYQIGNDLEENSSEQENSNQEDQPQSKKQQTKTEDLKSKTTYDRPIPEANPGKKPMQLKNLDPSSLKSNSIFDSAISPLNANRSHTFSFDFDALPLDSDHSDQVQSDEQVINGSLESDSKNNISGPYRKKSKDLVQDEIQQMSDNIQNLQILGPNIIGVDENILSSGGFSNPNNSLSNQKQEESNGNILSCDNYRRNQRCNSVNLITQNQNSFEKVDSYMVIDIEQQNPTSEKNCSQRNSNNEELLINSTKKEDSINMDLQLESKKQILLQNNQFGTKTEQNKKQIHNKQGQIDTAAESPDEDIFSKHFSSYLSYDIDQLCDQVLREEKN